MTVEDELQKILKDLAPSERVELLHYVRTSMISPEFDKRLDEEEPLRDLVKKAARLLSTSVAPGVKAPVSLPAGAGLEQG